MAHSTTPPHRLASTTAVLAVLVAALTACAGAPAPAGGEPRVRAVPADHATIQEAVDAAEPGDLILIDPGTYEEQVEITTPDLTIRGRDRNGVIVDGGGLRPYGIVSTADGTRIENLTVQRATFYGVLVTGLHGADGEPTAHNLDGYETLDPEANPPVQRFGISHVTAADNGLYGLYAFDAQHGYIRDSYASGSADSGIYVGQCRDCDVLVQGNVAERNAVGFENANASDSVVIVGNRFSGNRIGLTLLSNYQEAFTPQSGNTVAGNAILDNAQSESPSHADGGFGIGIGISGGRDNALSANLIAGNPVAGVLLAHTEDLPAAGNTFTGTAFEGNGVDVANISAARTPAVGNCVDGQATTMPAELLASCAADAPQPAGEAGALPRVDVPPGVSFLDVPLPPAQPGMPADDLDDIPSPLPDAVEMPDVAGIAAPGRDLLADRIAG